MSLVPEDRRRQTGKTGTLRFKSQTLIPSQNKKPIRPLVWLGTLVCSITSLPDASLYLSEIPPSKGLSRPSSITPSTARLLLAQRLGLAQYHELGDADDSTIDTLNYYEASQQWPLTRQELNDPRLLIIEVVKNPEGTFRIVLIPFLQVLTAL